MATYKEIRKKLEDLKFSYDNEPITFFIEINDDQWNQIFQTRHFRTIENALKWFNENCMFIDLSGYPVWLMYEVKNSDIDRFADIVYNAESRTYVLGW